LDSFLPVETITESEIIHECEIISTQSTQSENRQSTQLSQSEKWQSTQSSDTQRPLKQSDTQRPLKKQSQKLKSYRKFRE
jgi:hypothetical protein